MHSVLARCFVGATVVQTPHVFAHCLSFLLHLPRIFTSWQFVPCSSAHSAAAPAVGARLAAAASNSAAAAARMLCRGRCGAMFARGGAPRPGRAAPSAPAFPAAGSKLRRGGSRTVATASPVVYLNLESDIKISGLELVGWLSRCCGWWRYVCGCVCVIEWVCVSRFGVACLRAASRCKG